MGYRVDYAPAQRAFRSEGRFHLRIPVLSAVFFVIFVFLVRLYWREGTDILCSALFPGNLQAAGMALETFAQQLRMGESLGNCVEAFCREVIQGVQFAVS